MRVSDGFFLDLHHFFQGVLGFLMGFEWIFMTKDCEVNKEPRIAAFAVRGILGYKREWVFVLDTTSTSLSHIGIGPREFVPGPV